MKRWTVGLVVEAVLGLAMVPAVAQASIVLWNNEQVTINSSNSPTGDVILHDTSRAAIVSGGIVFGLYAHDSSTANMSGGSVINLWPHDSSIVNVSGGSVDGSLITNGSSTANISGGTVINWCNVYQSSTVNMSGGTLNNWLSVLQSSTVNLTGGTLGSRLDVCDSSVVTFYGRDFSLGGGLTLAGERVLGTGILGGEWMDGTPWSVNISRNDSGATIRLILEPAPVPEPSTLVIWSLLGGLGLTIGWRRKWKAV